jgi:hypothetical protein
MLFQNFLENQQLKSQIETLFKKMKQRTNSKTKYLHRIL